MFWMWVLRQVNLTSLIYKIIFIHLFHKYLILVTLLGAGDTSVKKTMKTLSLCNLHLGGKAINGNCMLKIEIAVRKAKIEQGQGDME